MLLRYLVNQWVRQAAEQKLRDAVAGAAQSQGTNQPTGDSDDQEPVPPAEVVFVFALGAESGGLIDQLQGAVVTRGNSFQEHAGWLNGRRVAVIESGVGNAAATHATESAIALHHPKWIVSTGFAGALVEDLRRGHILMADEVVDTQEHRLSVGLKIDRATIEQSKGLHTGRLLSVDHLIRTGAEKRQLGVQHDAVACDMETFAVATVCRRSETRFLSIRVISDAVEDELPKEIGRLLDQDTLASKLGAATGAIFNRPSSVKDLWKLKEEAIKASDRLARFLAATLENLPASD